MLQHQQPRATSYFLDTEVTGSSGLQVAMKLLNGLQYWHLPYDGRYYKRD